MGEAGGLGDGDAVLSGDQKKWPEPGDPGEVVLRMHKLPTGYDLLRAHYAGEIDEFAIALRGLGEAVAKVQGARERELDRFKKQREQARSDDGFASRHMQLKIDRLNGEIGRLESNYHDERGKAFRAEKSRDVAIEECRQLETRTKRLSRELADAQTHVRVAVYVAAVCLALGVWGWLV